ncbi:AAA family ATPase [Mahella australiensis]|uniref:ATPase associated with various cellular activities AAA_3 n=1 Tax=Mahella australiensis (strain DSM 15567 / CIP 107919 / 50-1 BON) TaxID=697281 RepID=F3ZYI9_MAHA5|nr:MoxR family ATPase [Mahella australiensis]AEE96731.1 ATPase associated with various cellular activities AAA_3 [Mahella australiensis 50-1 BON]
MMDDISAEMIESFADKVRSIESEISKEIIGQRDIIRQVLMTVIAGGNVLLEGVPGLGKTRLVKTLGHVLDLSFNRIQFTPDLMPADITGTNVIVKDEQGNNRFSFQAGPVFANIVLADEINRATPKTQSALLEAMQEHSVTVAGQTRGLPEPYFVLATQNPLEQEGTYPLPEAQLDRFFFKLLVDFPSLDELHAIIDLTTAGDEITANKAADGDVILHLREIARRVPIARGVQDYALRLVLATHPEIDGAPDVAKRYVRYGSSPRGAQAIIAASKVRALMEGRYNVSFDDIKYTAYPALRHRIFLNFEGLAEGRTPDGIIDEIINALAE